MKRDCWPLSGREVDSSPNQVKTHQIASAYYIWMKSYITPVNVRILANFSGKLLLLPDPGNVLPLLNSDHNWGCWPLSGWVVDSSPNQVKTRQIASAYSEILWMKSYITPVNVRILANFCGKLLLLPGQSFARFDLRLMTSVICVSGWLALGSSTMVVISNFRPKIMIVFMNQNFQYRTNTSVNKQYLYLNMCKGIRTVQDYTFLDNKSKIK